MISHGYIKLPDPLIKRLTQIIDFFPLSGKTIFYVFSCSTAYPTLTYGTSGGHPRHIYIAYLGGVSIHTACNLPCISVFIINPALIDAIKYGVFIVTHHTHDSSGIRILVLSAITFFQNAAFYLPGIYTIDNFRIP